jgi:hypothetical protein
LNNKEQDLRNKKLKTSDIVDKYELFKQEILKNLVSKKFAADSEFDEIKRIHDESLRNNEVAYAFSLSEEYLNKMNKKIDVDKKLNYILGKFNLSEDEIGLNNSMEEEKEESKSNDFEGKNLENSSIITSSEQDLSNDSILSKQTEEELDDKQEQFEDTSVLSKEELEKIFAGISNTEPLVEGSDSKDISQQENEIVSNQIPSLEKKNDDPQINFQNIIPKDVGKDVVERFIEEDSELDSEENSQSEELENESVNQEAVLPNSENEKISFETPKSQEEYWNLMYPKKDVEPYKKEFGKKMTLSELAKEVEKNGSLFKDEERVDEEHRYMGYQNAKNLGISNEGKLEDKIEKEPKKEKKGLLSLFNKKHKKKEESIETPVEESIETPVEESIETPVEESTEILDDIINPKEETPINIPEQPQLNDLNDNVLMETLEENSQSEELENESNNYSNTSGATIFEDLTDEFNDDYIFNDSPKRR